MNQRVAAERDAPRAAAVLLAAGRSTRMRAGAPTDEPLTRKPYLELAGRTLVELALATFAAATEIDELVLVAQEADRERLAALVARAGAESLVHAIVPGGAERVDSVRHGVLATSASCELVLVHDVARPFVRPDEVDAVARAVRAEGAALLARPVHDTIKRSPDGERTRETVPRAELWAAQTPQGLRRDRYVEALERARAEDFVPTDDAALFERYFGAVRLVEGSPRNFKITTRDDLAIARALAAELFGESAS